MAVVGGMCAAKWNGGCWVKIWRIGALVKLSAVMLLVVILLMGCASGSVGVDACGPWQPIYVGQADVLTVETGRQVLAHNEVGARLCGWRPRGS